MENALKTTFAKIQQSISNTKKSLLNKLPVYNNVIFLNRTLPANISSYQISICIQQFYESPNSQQSNTIKLPNNYFKALLTKKDKAFVDDDDKLEVRYDAFFGVHQDFYWLYFYKANVFISFHNNKIMFALNNVDKNEHNKALSSKNPNCSLYILYKENFDILIERSQRIIKWIYANQDIKSKLIQETNSHWIEFFNTPLSLSRFKNTTFEIIDPEIHLSKTKPIGKKIFLYPFYDYFHRSKTFSKYKKSDVWDFEAFLDGLEHYLYYKDNSCVSNYFKEIDYLTKREFLPFPNTALLDNFYHIRFEFTNKLEMLADIVVASPKDYYLFGFSNLHPHKTYRKKWITFYPHAIRNSDYFGYVKPYNGEDLTTKNIDIINAAIKQYEDYANYLNNFINKIKGRIDLSNANAQTAEYCQLLVFLNDELERIRLHREYLDDFSQQLFPQEIEVI